MPTAISVRRGCWGRLALIAFDRPLVTHAHAQPHLLFKVGGADTVFEVQGRTLPLTSDHAVLVEPWAAHAYPHPEGGEESLILALYLDDAWMEAQPGLVLPRTESVRLDPSAQDAALRLTKTAMNVVDGGQSEEAALLDLLAGLSAEPGHAPRRAVDPRVRRALALMGENLCDRPDLERVARESGLSRPRFFELFRQEVGVSPAVYWNGLRMDYAVAAAEGGDNLTAVSLDLGFSAPSNFTRFFRDIQGVSPSDYRRAAAKQTAR